VPRVLERDLPRAIRRAPSTDPRPVEELLVVGDGPRPRGNLRTRPLVELVGAATSRCAAASERAPTATTSAACSTSTTLPFRTGVVHHASPRGIGVVFGVSARAQ